MSRTITIRLEHYEMVHYTDLRDGKGAFAHHPPKPLNPGATDDEKRKWEADKEAAIREREISALENVLWNDTVRARIGDARVVVLKRNGSDEPRWQELA